MTGPVAPETQLDMLERDLAHAEVLVAAHTETREHYAGIRRGARTEYEQSLRDNVQPRLGRKQDGAARARTRLAALRTAEELEHLAHDQLRHAQSMLTHLSAAKTSLAGPGTPSEAAVRKARANAARSIAQDTVALVGDTGSRNTKARAALAVTRQKAAEIGRLGRLRKAFTRELPGTLGTDLAAAEARARAAVNRHAAAQQLHEQATARAAAFEAGGPRTRQPQARDTSSRSMRVTPTSAGGRTVID
jgi:hypothetical protein